MVAVLEMTEETETEEVDPRLASPQMHTWAALACSAFRSAAAGGFEQARQLYQQADEMGVGITLHPELSLLRHREGRASGRVVSGPQSESQILGFEMLASSEEAPDAYGLSDLVIAPQTLRASIRDFLASYVATEHHEANIEHAEEAHGAQSHLLVLSTGRCGTVALHRLLERTQYVSYHTFTWTPHYSDKFEMMCRLLTGEHSSRPANAWATCRAAEWLGAMSEGRPMATCAHLDTVFAPAFAALHRGARFIYLRRDPEAVFRSFYNKQQWNEGQLQPLYCAFPGGAFRWRRTAVDYPARIAWMIRFTEAFAEAFCDVLDGRCLHVDSEDLFSRDRAVIAEMLEFLGVPDRVLTLDGAVRHFGTVFNEKSHRAQLTDAEMAAPVEAFLAAYEGLAP